MKRRSVLNQNEQILHVDISPLLDVVFILLIFFIVTAVFVKETGVEIDKPSALSQSTLPTTSTLLALTKDGEVWHGGSHIGLVGVAPLLQQLKKEQKNIIIQADKNASTAYLVALIDACKLAGASSVNVATQQ